MCFFYKLKVCGNPVLSKSIDAIFPIALAHTMSLYHILYSFRIINLPIRKRIINVSIIIVLVMIICD